MASELRNTILNADDLEKEIVDVPEWGVKIEVRSMTAKERSRILQAAMRDGSTVNLERWFPDICIAACFDPDTGEKVFEPADRDALNSKNGAAINRVVEVAQRLAGMGETAVEDAKAGFDAAQSDDSISS